ncbi:ABC transporter ATP-binding protein [Pedobacter sp. ASV28]|uniref:ABC transporter ATP-binding protein n=1 Tax=Pedobacter sp. ASV28 TaxID=2795123 RepID=UPI0018ED10C4|nr:ABC transporter ATP-binding protein [Pedobacter sp. ASV28]
MFNTAIKAENLSKAYQLGEIGTGTLSRDLERWYARIRGKENPFSLIGQTNYTISASSERIWSLKDVNFEIEQGEAIGIIGSNGAGKSTLLKVLSRVTSPTSGCITGKGRIASLLEVGTGFHPELTGRENVYLNGAILGMRKKEIASKFDEIVNFAGVERYVDTPVKRYSSGMYVRLAFAVAAHLESEILIVDEVLAVGDAEFQQKCLGKMGEVSKGEGRTVLFVSHNMAAIKNLCTKSMLLVNGILTNFTDTETVVQDYMSNNDSPSHYTNFSLIKRVNKEYGIELWFKSCTLNSTTIQQQVCFGEKLSFNISIGSSQKFLGLNIGLRIEDDMGNAITGPRSMDQNVSFEIEKELSLTIDFDKFMLTPGTYYVTLTCLYKGICLDQVEKCSKFIVRQEPVQHTKPYSGAWGKVISEPKWKL